MAEKILFSLILVLTIINFSLGDREANSSGIIVKALGRSGKIRIGFKDNNGTDMDRVVVEMDELKERDANGSEVGKTGQPSVKHSFNTFASQDFTFTDIMKSTLQDINVTTFKFKSSLLEGSANLTVSVYIFDEDGNITLGDEQTEVHRGNVKFSILLENWKFCGSAGVTCRKGSTDEVGDFIDFVITIKGKGSPAPKNESDADEGKKRGKKYDLGGNSEVVLSNKVQYDGGNFTDMVSGYPKTVTQGSKTSFVFRFKKFSESVFYDPTMEIMPDSGGDSGGDGETTTKAGGGGPSGGVCRNSVSFISSFLMFVITIFVTRYM